MPNQTGPRTPEGKAKSAANAVKHGLTSKRMFCLNIENHDVWERHLAEWTERLQPKDNCELSFVMEAAHSQWRLGRAKLIETALIDTAMEERREEQDKKWASTDNAVRAADAYQHLCDNSRALENIQRYENRALRAFHRAISGLEKLRAIAPQPVSAPHNFPVPVPAPAPAPAPQLVATPDSRPQPEPPQTENVQNEMPRHLAEEFAAHRRRDPLFDPALDASQMSKALRRWFDKKAA